MVSAKALQASIDIAAPGVGLPGLFVEANGRLVEVIALGHELIHGFSALEQVLQVLVDDLLDFLQLALDPEQLVSFERVLPFSQVGLDGRELQRVVSRQLLIEDAR